MKSIVCTFLMLFPLLSNGMQRGPFELKDTLYGVIWAVELGEAVSVSCTGTFAKIEFYPTKSLTGLVDVYLKIKSKNAQKVTGGDFIRFMSNMAFWKDDDITLYAEDAISLNNPFQAISVSYDRFFNTIILSYGYKGTPYLDNVIKNCQYSIIANP